MSRRAAEDGSAVKRARRDSGTPPPTSEIVEDEEEAASGVAMAVAVWGSRCGVAWFDEGKVRGRDENL
jgi:hypothetical protein